MWIDVMKLRKNPFGMGLHNAKHVGDIGQFWVIATTIFRKAFSYPNDNSKSKPLSHMLWLWLSRSRARSISNRPTPFRVFFQLFWLWWPHLGVQNPLGTTKFRNRFFYHLNWRCRSLIVICGTNVGLSDVCCATNNAKWANEIHHYHISSRVTTASTDSGRQRMIADGSRIACQIRLREFQEHSLIKLWIWFSKFGHRKLLTLVFGFRYRRLLTFGTTVVSSYAVMWAEKIITNRG